MLVKKWVKVLLLLFLLRSGRLRLQSLRPGWNLYRPGGWLWVCVPSSVGGKDLPDRYEVQQIHLHTFFFFLLCFHTISGGGERMGLFTCSGCLPFGKLQSGFHGEKSFSYSCSFHFLKPIYDLRETHAEWLCLGIQFGSLVARVRGVIFQGELAAAPLFSLRSSMALRATSVSISGCLFVAGSGIWLHIAPVPKKRTWPMWSQVMDYDW